MKISDVEFQGDGRKATIYYTSDDRVDFRELVRQFSHQFRVKIEMRQIGPRQESARLGGIGSCGRELCCSTWLSDFQQRQHRRGPLPEHRHQPGEALRSVRPPEVLPQLRAGHLHGGAGSLPQEGRQTARPSAGLAILIKTDIFKGIMYYTYRENRGLLYPIPVAKVHEITGPEPRRRRARRPPDLPGRRRGEGREVFEYEDVTGAVELPAEKRRRNKWKSGSGGSDKRSTRGRGRKKTKPTGGGEASSSPTASDKPTASPKKRSGRGRRPMKKKPNGGE